MKIKGLADNINSLIGARNKKQIISEKTNFQDVLNKACLNMRENAPLNSLLGPQSINSPGQIKTNRPHMNSWEIRAIENALDFLEKYKDDLLDPHVSAKELKKEMTILCNKAEEIGQIFGKEKVNKDLLEFAETIKNIAKAEIETINRGDYD